MLHPGLYRRLDGVTMLGKTPAGGDEFVRRDDQHSIHAGECRFKAIDVIEIGFAGFNAECGKVGKFGGCAASCDDILRIDLPCLQKVTQCGAAEMAIGTRSEEHTSELQSLMRISYAVFCLKKKNKLYNKKCRRE